MLDARAARTRSLAASHRRPPALARPSDMATMRVPGAPRHAMARPFSRQSRAHGRAERASHPAPFRTEQRQSGTLSRFSSSVSRPGALSRFSSSVCRRRTDRTVIGDLAIGVRRYAREVRGSVDVLRAFRDCRPRRGRDPPRRRGASSPSRVNYPFPYNIFTLAHFSPVHWTLTRHSLHK